MATRRYRLPAVDILLVTATGSTNPIQGGCLCSDLGGVYVGKGGVSVAPPIISRRWDGICDYAMPSNKWGISDRVDIVLASI